jgi:hypothetical protein
MPILIQADYDAVRQAIEVNLTANDLPDAVIASPIYQGRAEAYVIDRVPTAESATGTAALHLRMATILYTAAYILPAYYAVNDEQVGDLRVRVNDSRIEQRISQLRGDADRELDEGAGVTPSPTAPTGMPLMFDLAYAGRGRSVYLWPED